MSDETGGWPVEFLASVNAVLANQNGLRMDANTFHIIMAGLRYSIEKFIFHGIIGRGVSVSGGTDGGDPHVWRFVIKGDCGEKDISLTVLDAGARGSMEHRRDCKQGGAIPAFEGGAQ